MAWLRSLANRIDDGVDRLTSLWQRTAGIDGEVGVEPFWGWGTTGRLTVSGQVAVRDGEPDAIPGDDILSDIRATIDRYIERGVMGARLRICTEGTEVLATTDSDGFYEASFDIASDNGEGVRWQDIEIVLEHVPGGRQGPSVHAGRGMIVPAGVDFGVISDFDDTVMKTGIHDFRRNWRMVIESDPDLREAFPGLPELYRALAFNGSSIQQRPMFYVSSAAWGFFDLFTRVIDRHDIPRGPLFLKNYGLDEDKWFAGGHGQHKTAAIERVFDTYPALSFVLVGDSGQDDPGIYRKIVERHPGRVKAVWIRDVADASRGATQALIDEVNEAGVPAAFGPDMLIAAREAAGFGWIPEDAIRGVEQAVEAARGHSDSQARP